MRPAGRLAGGVRRHVGRAGGRRAASGVEGVWGWWPGRAGAWPRPASGTRRRGSRASTPRRGYARPRRSPGRRSDLTHCLPFRRLSRGSVRPRADSGRRARPQPGCGGWGQSGATRRRDLFAAGRATRRHRPGCCRCRPRGRAPAFNGASQPYISGAGYTHAFGLSRLALTHSTLRR